MISAYRLSFNSLKQSAQVQYNYKNFFLYCSCIALVRTPAIQRCNTSFLQLAENLQATCSSCKKTCIVVVLHLCGPLKTAVIDSKHSEVRCDCHSCLSVCLSAVYLESIDWSLAKLLGLIECIKYSAKSW